ncbi:MAG: RDD family protein [Bacilli bacterium]|nr:RDD family protein [Bacilli bacterium]
MKSRRCIAYIIDTFLIIILLGILGTILNNTNMETLQVELSRLNESFLTKEIGFVTYLNHYSDILCDLDKQKVMINVLGILFMVGYFIIVPFLTKGKTLGKWICKIKVYKQTGMTMNDYIIRAFIINGLGYLLITVLLVLFLPPFSYFLTVSVLGLIQIILVFATAFMVLYNQSGKGIEDIVTESEVILNNEVKK